MCFRLVVTVVLMLSAICDTTVLCERGLCRKSGFETRSSFTRSSWHWKITSTLCWKLLIDNSNFFYFGWKLVKKWNLGWWIHHEKFLREVLLLKNLPNLNNLSRITFYFHLLSFGNQNISQNRWKSRFFRENVNSLIFDRIFWVTRIFWDHRKFLQINVMMKNIFIF